VNINPYTLPSTSIDDGNNRQIDQRKLKAACDDFEAMLIARMLKEMRNTTESKGESKGIIRKTDNPFMEMFDWEMSRVFAHSGSLGVSESLMRSLGYGESEDVDLTLDKSEKVDLYKGEMKAVINDAAKHYAVDPALIRSVIICESGGNPGLVSRRSAKGLMQLMDETARDLGVTDPFNPVQNIYGGTRYLRSMLDTHDNNLELALAAYNAGPSTVEAYGGIPPFPETQNYIRRILDLYRNAGTEKAMDITDTKHDTE